jgi:hypothetical protein
MKFWRTFNRSILAAVTALFLFVPGSADAQSFTQALMNTYSCSSSNYGTSGTYFNSHDATGGYGARSAYNSVCSANNTGNTSSSVVTAIHSLRIATAQTVGMIGSRISAAKVALNTPVGITAASLADDLSSGELGLAAGNSSNGLGFWVQGKFASAENDQTVVAADIDVITTMVGIDKRLSGDRVLIGVAASHETSSMDTAFNNGSLDGTGYVISPYLSLQLSDSVNFDATGGYSTIQYDHYRLDPVTNEKFTSSGDGERLFGSAFLSVSNNSDKLMLSAEAGASYSQEDRDAFTETGTTGQTVSVSAKDTTIGQGMIGAKAALKLGRLTPFVSARGEFDFSKSNEVTVATDQQTADGGDFGLRFTAGADVALTQGLSLYVEGSTVQLRDDYSEYSGALRIRAEF